MFLLRKVVVLSVFVARVIHLRCDGLARHPYLLLLACTAWCSVVAELDASAGPTTRKAKD